MQNDKLLVVFALCFLLAPLVSAKVYIIENRFISTGSGGAVVNATTSSDYIMEVFGNGNITGLLFVNNSQVCTADNGLCAGGGGGSGYTQWRLAAGNTSGSTAITNNTLVNITAADGGPVVVTRSGATIIINTTIGSGSGDIEGVLAGTGLIGGGTSGTVTLNVSGTACSSGEYSRYNGTAFNCFNDQSGSSGTVTQVSTGDGVVGGPITTTGTVSLNWTRIVDAIGNWTQDKPSYVPFSALSGAVGQNLTLAQIVTNIGNWSSDRGNYVNFTTLNGAVGQNLTLAAINTNMGNWSSDKLSYATIASLNQVNTSSNIGVLGTSYGFITSVPYQSNAAGFSNTTSLITASYNITAPNITVNGALRAGSTNLTTAQIIEGTNLYYTDARVAAAIQNTTIVRASSAQCSGTDQVTNVTVNASGVFLVCSAQGSGGGMSSWTASNGSTTATITDGQRINWTAGTGITITQTNRDFTISSTITQYTDALAIAAVNTSNYYQIQVNHSNVLNMPAYLTSVPYQSSAAGFSNTTSLITANYNITAPNITINGHLRAASTNLTTTQITEGNNLYFTDTRAATAVVNTSIIRNNTDVAFLFGNFSTINVTTLRAGTVNFTTTQVTEGSNLYFTDTRAASAVQNTTIIRNQTRVNFTGVQVNNSAPWTYNGTCHNISGATTQWLVC